MPNTPAWGRSRPKPPLRAWHRSLIDLMHDAVTAILYVAGRAVRLGAHTQGRHKVLLEFGGQSLLERHLSLLAHFGVPKLFIVTGYLREQLQASFPALQSR